MDNTTRDLAHFVTDLEFACLPARTVHETKKRLVDTVACAIGGFDGLPAAIARRVASCHSGIPSARIFGTGASTSMEMATFANAVMVRYLDYNDTYISKGSGHPSDMTCALLAVAEAYRSTGAETLAATVAAYEIYTAMADAVALRDLGWDQGLFVVIGCAAGAAKLMRLSATQTGHAIAIAVTANVPTRQTRAGELSMWKGVATAAAARAGVSAAILAAAGMTGPSAAFEGKDGLWDRVTGRFVLATMGSPERPFGIERTNLKFFPSEYHSQAPLWMALDLHKQVAARDIESVEVQTYFTAWSEIGSAPELWHPQTRETADHSLPYLLALALMDGRIATTSFDDARLHDPATLAVMNRIEITENPDYTRHYPDKLLTRIELLTRDGRRIEISAQYPKGHALNPMSDDDVNTKFAMTCDDALDAAQRDALLDALWRIDRAPDLTNLVDLLEFRSDAEAPR